MFGLGVLEIGVVCLLAVILFPPRELPKLARSIARMYGSVKRTADDFKHALLEDPDLNAPIDEIKGAYRETRWQVKQMEETARRELAKAEMDARLAARSVAADIKSVPGRVPAGDLAEDIEEPEELPEAAASVASEVSDPSDEKAESAGEPTEAPAPVTPASTLPKPPKTGAPRTQGVAS